MHKLSDFESGGSKVVIATHYPTNKRQVARSGPINVDGHADFILPVAAGNIRHLVNFETLENSWLTQNQPRVQDEVFNVYSSLYWKLYGGADIRTEWKKFGTSSLFIPNTYSYCSTVGTVPQYRDAPNGWTEEFVYKSTTDVKYVRLFSAWNPWGYGVVLETDNTGRLRVFLSGGGVWDISYGEFTSLVLANNSEYSIALEYDNTTYRLYVNGQIVWSKASGKKILPINTRTFGWSSNAGLGYYDEYRFSAEPRYLGTHVPPTEPHVLVRDKKVRVVPSEDRPIQLSLSDSVKEHSLVISERLLSGDLIPNNTNYLYIDLNKTTNEYSLGSTPIEPQYGQSFDFSKHSLLTFDSVSGEVSDDAGGFNYESASPGYDKYGNIWIANNVAIKKTAGATRRYAVFDGASSYLQSEIYSLPKKWTIRIVHSVKSGSGTRALFTYGGNTNGYGIYIDTRPIAGGNFEYLVSISTNGVSWNIASSAIAEGGGLDVPVSMSLSFDGKEFRLNVEGVYTKTWASADEPRAAFNGKLELGRRYNTMYYLGNIYEFSLEPMVMRNDGMFKPNLPPPSIRDDIHFFNIVTMEMRKSNADSPSLAPDSPPPFNEQVVRLFIGEATLDAEGVVDAITYSLNGTRVIDWYPVSAPGKYDRQHNIGSTLVSINTFFNIRPRDSGKMYLPSLDAVVGQWTGPAIWNITPSSFTVQNVTYAGRWFAPGAAETTGAVDGYYKHIVERAF